MSLIRANKMNKFQYTDNRSITETEILNNPTILYIFGDNLLRKGYGGQARVCRGKSNTFGIRVKKEPNDNPNSFFTDREFFKLSDYIKEDIVQILKLSIEYKKIFILSNIGEGRARLLEKAPKLYDLLKQLLDGLINISPQSKEVTTEMAKAGYSVSDKGILMIDKEDRE